MLQVVQVMQFIKVGQEEVKVMQVVQVLLGMQVLLVVQVVPIVQVLLGMQVLLVVQLMQVVQVLLVLLGVQVMKLAQMALKNLVLIFQVVKWCRCCPIGSATQTQVM